jgi:hypothetical protein
MLLFHGKCYSCEKKNVYGGHFHVIIVHLYFYCEWSWIFFASQDGQKPIQVAAARGNREAVEILFPLTTKVQSVREWTVDGILVHMLSEANKEVLRSLKICYELYET